MHPTDAEDLAAALLANADLLSRILDSMRATEAHLARLHRRLDGLPASTVADLLRADADARREARELFHHDEKGAQ